MAVLTGFYGLNSLFYDYMDLFSLIIYCFYTPYNKKLIYVHYNAAYFSEYLSMWIVPGLASMEYCVFKLT